MIFIDSNIPMYLVGGHHPHKADAQILLERCIASKESLVTDAEVLQEILHRYCGINRRDAIAPAMKSLLGVVDEVFPIEREDVVRASNIVQGPELFLARDALHLAVMERHGVLRVLSFDEDFDRWPGITRLHKA